MDFISEVYYDELMENFRFSPENLVPSATGAKIHNYPYLALCIDEYLPLTIDRELSATFPDHLIVSPKSNQLAHYFDLTDDSVAARVFLTQHQIWSEYVQTWQSIQNLQHCIKVFQGEILKRYIPIWRWLLKRRVLNPKNLEVTVILSIYKQGFRLSPHSDDKYKLLSFIHYIPTHDSVANLSGGTIFYFPRVKSTRSDLRQFSEWSRGVRRYLPLWMSPSIEASLGRRYTKEESVDHPERKLFERYFEHGFAVGYQQNRLCGFVKSDWSMHEVDLNDFPDGEPRRAVLTNIRLKPSSFSKLIPAIEKLLSRCKKKMFHRNHP